MHLLCSTVEPVVNGHLTWHLYNTTCRGKPALVGQHNLVCQQPVYVISTIVGLNALKNGLLWLVGITNQLITIIASA